MSEPNRPLHRRDFTRQFFRSNRLNFLLCLLCYVLWAGLQLAIAWLIQQLVDLCTGVPGPFRIGQVGAACCFLLGVQVAVYGLSALCEPAFQARAMVQYREYSFRQISRKRIGAFTREHSGLYLSALTSDAAAIERDYLALLPKLIHQGICFLGAFAMMFFYSPRLTLASLALSALPVAASILTGNRLAHRETAVSEHNDRFLSTLRDCLSGFSVIKAFRAEGPVTDQISHVTRDLEQAKARRNRMGIVLECLGSTAGITAQFGVFLYGAYLAVSGGGISPGTIMAFTQLMNYVIGPIGTVPQYLAKQKAALALIDKLAQALSQNTQDCGRPIPQTLEQAISLEDVSFSYDGETPALSHVSFRFMPNRSYAIVGASGSGKSTLLQLLMSAHPDYQGSIRYDGADLREISTDSLYGLVCLVQQNVFLFNATIRDNITMFRSFPAEAVDRAICRSGLGDLIRARGEDFLCGENGCNLSGGEKQRVSIARSLLQACPVLLMDEATAALDRQTAHQITGAILDLKDTTRILVTHSLDASLLRRYDTILTIKNGCLVEHGTFDELMARREYFYSLYHVSQ